MAGCSLGEGRRHQVPFEYDVFLSYASEDRAWAERVENALRSENLASRIFFDIKSMRAGDDWEAKIRSSLEDSQSLIVLWSKFANQSEWVSKERILFQEWAKPASNPNRRLIYVNLQGASVTASWVQHISRDELQKAYAGAALSPDVWKQITVHIVDGLNPAKRPLPVPLVVLTSTVDELLNGLSRDQRREGQTELGLTSALLKKRYGSTRSEWKPYGGNEPVQTFMDKIQNGVNLKMSAYRMEWRLPPDEFWSDIQAARDFVQKEFDTAELSVLIIDPVAIYHRDLLQRLLLFQDSLSSNRRVIVSLPPFDVPERLRQLRKTLSNRSTPYFDDYFLPSIPPKRVLTAQCAWNIADGEDVKRHILAAAGFLGMSSEASQRSAFTSHGQAE
jgi:TIR domain